MSHSYNQAKYIWKEMELFDEDMNDGYNRRYNTIISFDYSYVQWSMSVTGD